MLQRAVGTPKNKKESLSKKNEEKGEEKEKRKDEEDRNG